MTRRINGAWAESVIEADPEHRANAAWAESVIEADPEPRIIAAWAESVIEDLNLDEIPLIPLGNGLPLYQHPQPQPAYQRWPDDGTIPTVDEFTCDRTPVFVEAAFGGGVDSTQWQWTDLTRLLLSDASMSVRRGRPNEAAGTDPSSVSVRLDNIDGALTPHDPRSPFYPHIVPGLPMRVSAVGGTPALWLPGAAGAVASTPHSGAFNLGAEFDIRARIEPDAWSTGVDWFGDSLLLNRHQEIVTHMAGEVGWSFGISNAGYPLLVFSSGGTIKAAFVDELVAFPAATWLAVTRSGGTITYYATEAETPPANVTTWTQIGSVSESAAIDAVSTPLVIGGRDGGAITGFRGQVHAVEIRSAVNGPLVAAPTLTGDEGATSMTDPTGATWTTAGAAQLTARYPVMVGEVAGVDIEWPFNDHHHDHPTQPSESRVTFDVAGILRRIGRNDDPTVSALRRHLSSERFRQHIHAYWPCEDGRLANRFARGINQSSDLNIDGVLDLAADDSLPATAPLPRTKTDDAATITGTISGIDPGDEWAVDWLAWFRPDPVPDPTEEEPNPEVPRLNLLTLESAGAAVSFDATLESIIISVGGVEESWPLLEEWVERWLLLRLQWDGAELRWTLLPLDTALAWSAPVTATPGIPNGVSIINTGHQQPYVFGHIVVHNNQRFGWLAGADTAWISESAAHRIWRLCTENGIPCEIIGESDPAATLRGDITKSEPMGPQSQAPLLTLLREAVMLDGGMLLERRGSPGLIYRTRQSLQGSAAVMDIDAASHHLAAPFRPVVDDQRLRNDVEVKAQLGASARLSDQASIDISGRYDAAVTVNGVGGVSIQQAILDAVAGLADAVDNQNLERAQWLLTLGTVSGLRYPRVGLALHLVESDDPMRELWRRLEPGDLVTISDLPAQHPEGTLTLMVEGWSEVFTPNVHRAELVCSPGLPWLAP